MEKCISGSYPFCAKNKWFGENKHIGLNRFILLCFSGFKFLREEKEQEASIVSTNIDWLFSMLPGTRLHFLWLFLLLKLLSTMRKKLLDVSLLIPKVAPERPFLLSFFFLSKSLWFNLGVQLGIVYAVFPTWSLSFVYVWKELVYLRPWGAPIFKERALGYLLGLMRISGQVPKESG